MVKMKEKTNTYMNWNNKEIELNKDEFIKKWTDHTEIYGLKSWRDINGTEKMYNAIMDQVKELAGHTFDLKADNVHIYYGMDGKVESHRVGKKYLIKNYEEVENV
jgi:hypothetical protein